MHFESLNDTFPNGDESNGRKKIPLTNPRFDSCPFHIWLIPIHPLNHYHQPQTKLAKPPPVDILVHWWRSPILPPWKFWNGGWWGFVGEVRLHTPLKENITNTNRWMFKPLRVMYSKATGKPWKLWDEGPCNSSNVIICWVLPLPIVAKDGLALGFPTKTDQNPGGWYRPFVSVEWDSLNSNQSINRTICHTLASYFHLGKKGLQIEETEEICLSNWLISAKTMWRFKTTKFKWIKSSPIEITFKLMLSGTRVVDGFNPFENYMSNWIISPSGGENKNLNIWNHHPEHHRFLKLSEVVPENGLPEVLFLT